MRHRREYELTETRAGVLHDRLLEQLGRTPTAAEIVELHRAELDAAELATAGWVIRRAADPTPSPAPRRRRIGGIVTHEPGPLHGATL